MRNILKIECKDEIGLIYRACDIIFKSGLNIQSNNEFVDRDSGRFFFRAELSGEVKSTELVGLLRAVLPDGAKIEFIEKSKKDIVVLATKESHCLGDMLVKFDSGELNANIKAVIANQDSLKSLTERFGVPFHFISAEGISRDEHEKLVLQAMAKYSFDYAVLAKYMRILSPNFIACYPQKIINIHHSFLPAFIGANPYKQAYERGVKIIGATAHFVTDDLDEGPIITQDVVRVDHTMSSKQMQRRGRACESSVLGAALDLVFDDRVFISGNKVIVF